MQDLNKNQTIGIIWFVVHCLMFSLISITTKFLLSSLHVAEIVFFQTFIGTLILLPMVLRKHKISLTLKSSKIHLLRAFFWFLATVLFFISIQYIRMPKAIAISFAVPLFTTIMAVIFLKEKLYRHRTIALIFGFIGMMVIIQPGFDDFKMASLLVVAASFCWSITDIMIKNLSKSHHAIVNTFFFAMFSAICAFPFAVIFWETPNLKEISMLIFLGILFVFNMYSVSKSYEHAELTIIMPFAFTQLIFIAILSYIFFGEIVALTSAIGSAVIIASTSYMAYAERKYKKKHRIPPHDI